MHSASQASKYLKCSSEHLFFFCQYFFVKPSTIEFIELNSHTGFSACSMIWFKSHSCCLASFFFFFSFFAAVQVTASFDMQGVRGTISFRQTSRNAPVVINVQLQGISGLAGLTWHVHEYPLPYDIAMSRRCSAAAVGSHFDPFRKASLPGYSLRCARNAADCEIGDLSGRHGDLVPSREMQDRFLTLYGQEQHHGPIDCYSSRGRLALGVCHNWLPDQLRHHRSCDIRWSCRCRYNHPSPGS